MNPHRPHIDDQGLEALLDGALSEGEARAARRHLAACPACRARYRETEALFAQLSSLPRLEPGGDFSGRVMAAVRAETSRAPLGALAARLGRALRHAVVSPHLAPEVLGAWVDDELAPAARARVDRHLAACGRCAGEARTLRHVGAHLEALPRYAPAEGFADRVMAQVRVAQESPAAREARAGAPSRALAWAARLLPRSRRVWAALAGASVTPAVSFGLVLYAVFSHPEVTPGALVSFLAWKADELLEGLSGSMSGALGGAGHGALGGLVQAVSGAPLLAAAFLVLYVAVCALALRVLYRNIIAPNLTGSRYVRAIVS